MRLKNKILNCQSLSEAARLVLGVGYYNSRITKLIIKTCFEKYNVDIINIINQNKLKHKKYCLNCGKELTKGQKKFCSSSCAATYNNKQRGKRSEETKKKISQSVKKHIITNLKEREEKGKYVGTTFLYEKTCPTCGEVFFHKNKNIKFCSKQCAWNSEETKEKIRKKHKERIENGTFKGWQKRNVVSYAENFFIEVLNNNSIEYIREDFSTKKYFLDFLICLPNGIKIDLEIDGKQHEYPERKEKDKIRDEYLTEHEFIVYRIKWNKLTNKKGKEEMKRKIDDFLEFYDTMKNK